LLQNSSGDSGTDLSFDKSASPERLFSLARASLAEASKPVLSFGYAAIDDPRPVAGSFNMADVPCLSAHVIKLRDMPEGVLVLSGLSRVWKSRVCDPVLRGANGNVMGIHDFHCLYEWTSAEVQEEPHLDVRPTLQRLPFYCTPPAAADVVIPEPTPEDLAVGDSDDESDGDDDACVKIPLVTPLRSVAVISPSGNQGRSSATPAAEGSNTRDSRDFFPFSAGPYYATYPEDGVAGNYEFTREEWDASY
ncbi:hypothetical protein Tco_0986489, partial [Tanacetum coccineum]